MKVLFNSIILLVLLIYGASAQEKSVPTDSFSIEGNVKNQFSVSLSMITALPKHDLGDIVVKNHAGVEKNRVTKAKGVLLRDVLKNLVLDTDQPKIYSEYYLAFIASDGYKVIFSWNEIFNGPAGAQLFVLTEMDNTSLDKMDGRIAVISLSDTNNGRRFVKGLAKIKVVHE